MDYSTLWGVTLITCAGIAFALGLYATNVVFKTTINKLLMIACTALVIWSLGLAITAAADTVEISKIGHLLAPIGWGPMSGLLLHLTLLLTGKKRLLQTWWIYPLLYLPGLVLICVFAIYPAMSEYVHTVRSTPLGWVPVVDYNIWDYLFYVYYIGFTVVNLIVLLVTRKNSSDKNQRFQMTLLATCYIIAYTLGTLTDVVSGHLGILIPRYATVFSLIPLGAIAYIVKTNGPISTGDVKRKELFRNEFVPSDVYRIMGFGFGLGSILNILSQKLIYKETGISYIDEFSIFLLIIAIFILIINKLKIDGIVKEISIAIVYSFIIPYITLRYVQYGGITIWAFAFLLIIICLLYNRQILLITITVSAIMTQILVWTVSPIVLVAVDMADYIVRLGFIGISVILALYVNSIYTTKLAENYLYIDKEAILSETSRNFISAAEWNKDVILDNLLEKCGNFINSERSYIILFEEDSTKFKHSYEWLSEGTPSLRNKMEKMYADILPIMLEQYESQGLLKILDSDQLAATMGEFKELLFENNIRGLINYPLRKNHELMGFICFNSSKPVREWTLDATEFLEIVANLVSDMLVKIKVEERNEHLAYYDQLTQLPNRLLIKEYLEKAIKHAKGTEEIIAVIFMDIDSFKIINDTLGHALGDRVLFEVGQVLSHTVRNNDTVGRFGGDEFVIVLNHLFNATDAIEIMDKIMSALKKPLYVDGQEIYVTTSVGIALYPPNGEDSETLIKNADTAMYMAKEMGKNRYLVCSQDMERQALEKMILANSIHRALEREQLMVYYQPQIDLSTKTIVGLEALLRWFLPEKGMINPATFIPIAEQTGLINPIGEWVLETACRQNKLWQDKGYTGLRMAVNISVHQLHNPRFVQQVEGILEKTGLSANDLELEITESVVSKNDANMVHILAELKALGVKISIDDFGTEYSSLSRLKSLPIDRIKIDFQFIRGIEGEEKDRAITKVIINLAKSLNLKVIAEGVETKTQLDFLSHWLCDEVQGFYYYKPMPAEEIEEILFQ